MSIVLRVAVLLIAGVAYPAFALAQAYHVIDINAPEGFELLVTGLNNRNEVVGHVFPRRLPGGAIKGPMDVFLWDANGFRILGLRETYVGLPPGIDDAGAIYGLRRLGSINTGLFKWVNGIVEDLPTPPYPTVFSFKVKSNGDVRANTNWLLHGGVWYDLKAISGFDSVLDVNEQGIVAGCVSEIVPNRPDAVSRPVLRSFNGRVFQPWDEGCVSILGAGGHFGGYNLTPTADPDDYYYGTPDGRVSNVRTTATMSFKDMNRHGVMLGYGFATQFVFAGETVTDLVQAPTSTGGTVGPFVAVAINDLGYIAGFREVFGVIRGVLLVPVPSAPSPLTFTVTDRTVKLDWQASRDALHYVIEAGSASSAADLYYASVGARTSLTVAAPPGRYYVRVRAGGALGYSPPSNEVIIDVR